MTNLSNLTVEEQDLISDMNERLKRLEVLLDEALEKETPETFKQWLADKRNPPIDTTEPNYVRIAKVWEEVASIEEGRVYKTKPSGDPNFFMLELENGNWTWTYKNDCQPATEAEYLAQEQGKEWKLEVGKFVWNSPNKALLGLVKEFSDHKNKVYVDLQNGTCEWWHTNILVKPTDKDVENCLVAIAEKKYPVGSRVKFGKFTKEISVPLCFKYKNGKLECADFEYWTPTNGWAELAPIETEQRWKPNLSDCYYYIKSNLDVQYTIYSHRFLDEPRINSGNCFKTEEEAKEIAAQIKTLLSK